MKVVEEVPTILNSESELLNSMKILSELSSGILKFLEEKDSRYKKSVISSDEIDDISNNLTQIENELESIDAESKRIKTVKKLKKKFAGDFYPRMKKYEMYNRIADAGYASEEKYNIIRFMKSLKQIQEINCCTMKKPLKFIEIEK